MPIDPQQVLSLIKKTSNLPVVKVDRKNYLVKEFSMDYSQIMDDIINLQTYDNPIINQVFEKVYTSIYTPAYTVREDAVRAIEYTYSN